jgi:hypothetical protein
MLRGVACDSLFRAVRAHRNGGLSSGLAVPVVGALPMVTEVWFADLCSSVIPTMT